MNNKEFQTIIENERELETITHKENVNVLEQIEVKETEIVNEIGGSNTSIKNSKKKNKIFSLLTTTTTTVIVGGALIGVTNLVNVNLDAKFLSLKFEDSVIKYELEVEDYKKENQLIIYLYNEDETVLLRYEVDEIIEEDIISGFVPLDIEDINQKLIENDVVTYYFELKGDVGLGVERSFDRYRLEINGMTSVFNEVTHWCNCKDDGYYYFKMDFIDDYGLFSDFKAYIIDKGDNKFECELSNNLHEEQKIYVKTAYGGNGKLIIEYLANGEQQNIELEIII